MSDPPELKIVDRRFASEDRLEKTAAPAWKPDDLAEIRLGSKPREFVAVFPGNRVQEHPFRFSKFEADGAKFADLIQRARAEKRPAPVPNPYFKRALKAARLKVERVIRRAGKVHEAAGRPVQGVH